jgi:hypothetical protein
MNIQHLAARYVGELTEQPRIKARAANATANRDAVLTALTRTDRDDDSYLAALAREYKRLNVKVVDATESVTKQTDRFAAIRTEVRALSNEDEFEFWDHVNAMCPNAPTHQIGGRRYTKVYA